MIIREVAYDIVVGVVIGGLIGAGISALFFLLDYVIP